MKRHPVRNGHLAGRNDNRRNRRQLRVQELLKAEIHPGHRLTQHQIENDQRERLRLRRELAHAAFAVREFRDHIAVQLQELRETFADFRAIFNEQNLASPRRSQ